jgi:hypothetical protein
MIKDIILTILILFLTLYISLLSPELPQFIQKLFNNTLFKIIILFIFIYINNEKISPKITILLVIAYVLTLDYIFVINSKKIKETAVYKITKSST